MGWGPDADVRLPEGSGTQPAAVTVTIEGGESASVAPVQGFMSVSLNGAAVTGPSPILHGDNLRVGQLDLRFGDEGKLGDTVELDTRAAAIAVPNRAARNARSEGRLVSLVDGREYVIGERGLSVGRDPSCDIVISRLAVSRRHAAIRPATQGYVLLDTSVNGVYVNEARVQAELPLARGDTIRVDHEEFRFYANEAPDEASPANPALSKTGAFAAARRPTPPSVGTIADAPLRVRPVFGFFEVINEGPTKGTRHELDSPKIAVGRGSHNDVVLADESVSEHHAKLQRRDDSWYLIDLGSTNGTYVGGDRVADEVKLESGADVRFGGVKLRFHATGQTARPSGGTRVIVGVKGADPKRSEPSSESEPTVNAAVGSSKGGLSLLWAVIVVVIGFALFSVVWRGGL